MAARYRYELHAGIMLVAAVVAIVSGRIAWLIPFAVMGFILMFYMRSDEYRSNGVLGGAANWITLVRLVVLLVAIALQGRVPMVLFGSAVLLVIIADGFDGYVARKFGLATSFGADFDMETDALLACSLSIIAFQEFDVSLLVPFAGLLRYLFVFTLRIAGMYRYPPPKMRGVRLIAVLFFIALITPYFIEPPLAGWSMEVAAALIVFSFAREYYLRVKVKVGRTNGSE